MMCFLKKDLEMILSKRYVSLAICITSLLLFNGFNLNIFTLGSTAVTNPNIIYIDVPKTLSIYSFFLIFGFVGTSIPMSLFKLDENLIDTFIISPKSNFSFVLSKIIASTIVMAPLILINMALLKCFTLNIFLFTFLIGVIFIILSSFSLMLPNNLLGTMVSAIATLLVLSISLIKNPFVSKLDTIINLYGFSNEIPIIIILELVGIVILSLVILYRLFLLYLKRRMSNG